MIKGAKAVSREIPDARQDREATGERDRFEADFGFDGGDLALNLFQELGVVTLQQGSVLAKFRPVPYVFVLFRGPLAFSLSATISTCLRRDELSSRGLGQGTERPPRQMVEWATK